MLSSDAVSAMINVIVAVMEVMSEELFDVVMCLKHRRCNCLQWEIKAITRPYKRNYGHPVYLTTIHSVTLCSCRNCSSWKRCPLSKPCLTLWVSPKPTVRLWVDLFCSYIFPTQSALWNPVSCSHRVTHGAGHPLSVLAHLTRKS